LRATAIVALTAPTSLLSAFIYLYFRGMTLNIITIASMIVSLGMLVDNAIVVMENIHRHRAMGKDRATSARKGAAEVALAISASTLTTIVVFIPVLYLESGELTMGMRTFAGPVTVSLLTSLLLAVTVIPVAEVALMDREHHPVYKKLSSIFGGTPGRIQRLYARVQDLHIFSTTMALYGKAVGLTITHRIHAFSLVALMTAITLLIPVRRVGMQQMPSMDMRELRVGVNFEKNYTREMADEVFDRFKAIIEPQRTALGIRNVYVDYGTWGGQIRLFLLQAQDLLPGEDYPYTTEQVREILAQQFPERIPGGKVDLGIAESGPSDTGAISARVYGDDADTVAEVAERFCDLLEELPYVREATTDREKASQEIQLDVDETIALQAGLNPMAVARTVDFALRGVQLPYLRKEGREVPVRAQFAGEERRSKEDLESMEVAGPSGKLVPLSNVTSLRKGYASVSLNRENGKSVARVTASVSMLNMTVLGEDMERLIAAIELPPGCSFQTGEEMSELDRTMRNYHQALILAIALIYLVMAAIFESVLLPFSILSTVPLAFLGVYWALYLTGTLIDTISLIGAILMCGVVVNNGIVIVDHINQLRKEGLDRHTAVTQAGINRFRPVMMTALTTILGCVPLAIGTGKGNDALNSLGRALVGGLTTSTFLTLLVVPLFYTFIDDGREWLMRYVAAIVHFGQRPGVAPKTESPSVH
jgi:HAE1 family hydrophobic/amphiphilic exporter-1